MSDALKDFYITPPENDLPTGETGSAVSAKGKIVYYTGWIFDPGAVYSFPDRRNALYREKGIDHYAEMAAESSLDISQGITVYSWKKLPDGRIHIVPCEGRTVPAEKKMRFDKKRRRIIIADRQQAA